MACSFLSAPPVPLVSVHGFGRSRLGHARGQKMLSPMYSRHVAVSEALRGQGLGPKPTFIMLGLGSTAPDRPTQAAKLAPMSAATW